MIVRGVFAALAAAAASLFATVAFAQDQDLAAQFQSFCLATDGAPQAVALAARGAGYVRPPEVVLRPLIASAGEIQNPSALWKVYDGGVLMVITGQLAGDSGSPLAGDTCMVLALPSDAEPTPGLRALLGVGDPIRQRDIDMFVYEQRDGARQSLRSLDAASLRRAAAQGRLRIAAGAHRTRDATGVSVVMLIRPHFN